MNIKPIRNDEDLTQAFLALEKVFQVENGTPEADERDILLALIESYEAKHYPIAHANPIEAIKFKMEQQNLTRDDLVPYLGAKSKISEVLNGKRPLSLNMIKNLHHGLQIPYESLIA
ncbi:helix-turn-helix domain-containing protein [Pelistega suis]|uniref:Transcriptional regulator n=1 Tax=Pelistega suis TaxID=1631957 RepID=A0A849P3Q3_9BURK|nr:transcriptional regulator [Pelistega suis]MCQ9328284.1 transcriptional regulator [Pelistega suis]NOL51686.1 transcriptional regulator [Pelistega suis]